MFLYFCYMSSIIKVSTKNNMNSKTKILATVGPATSTPAKLKELFVAGANAARLNFSHDTLDGHKEMVKKIRAVEKALGRHIGIIGDLQGPKMRIGKMPESGVLLKDDEFITLDTGMSEYTEGRIPVPSPIFEKGAMTGGQVFLDDGSILLEIISCRRINGKGKRFVCRVLRGGTLFSNKGINVPQLKLRVHIFEKRDKEAIQFAILMKLDYLAVSFVRNAADMKEARRMLKGAPIKLIAKIERPEAIEHLDAIIAASDAIMVARGDLGIETPLWQLPVRQKEIIERARAAMKPVIVATQMLESMTKNSIPTRAEVSDVANAVYDGADGVMLSAETASGKHPIAAVVMMRRILSETETHGKSYRLPIEEEAGMMDIAVSRAAKYIAKQLQANIILVGTTTGHSARAVAMFRPTTPIVAITSDNAVARRLTLVWGVSTIVATKLKTIADIEKHAFTHLKRAHRVAAGDTVVFVTGRIIGAVGETNTVAVLKVE